LFETAFHSPPWDRYFFIEYGVLQAAREKVLDLRDTVLPFLQLNAKEQSSKLDQDIKEQVEEW